MCNLKHMYIYVVLLIMFFIYNNNTIQNNTVIVTGSSSNHELYLLNLLKSLLIYNKRIDICVWDLGLSTNVSMFLSKKLVKSKINLKKFIFSNYPPYFNIIKKAGEFAWKPVIIHETYNHFKKNLIWLDAGCEVNGSVNDIIEYIKRNDIWSLSAKHSIRKYTYYKTIQYFNVNDSVSNNTCCSGGIVGFKYPSYLADKILNKWCECAFDLNCIAPKGSNRNNHRQDQSAFSIIVNIYNKKEICYLKGFHVMDHIDSNNKAYNKLELMNEVYQLIELMKKTEKKKRN